MMLKNVVAAAGLSAALFVVGAAQAADLGMGEMETGVDEGAMMSSEMPAYETTPVYSSDEEMFGDAPMASQGMFHFGVAGVYIMAGHEITEDTDGTAFEPLKIGDTQGTGDTLPETQNVWGGGGMLGCNMPVMEMDGIGPWVGASIGGYMTKEVEYTFANQVGTGPAASGGADPGAAGAKTNNLSEFELKSYNLGLGLIRAGVCSEGGAMCGFLAGGGALVHDLSTEYKVTRQLGDDDDDAVDPKMETLKGEEGLSFGPVFGGEVWIGAPAYNVAVVLSAYRAMIWPPSPKEAKDDYFDKYSGTYTQDIVSAGVMFQW